MSTAAPVRRARSARIAIAVAAVISLSPLGATGAQAATSAAQAPTHVTTQELVSTGAAVAAAKKKLTSSTPKLSGRSKVGQRITAKPGSWTSGTRLTYQWLRNGKAIGGATKPTYTPVKADAGKKLSVKVTGTKAGYASTSRTSAGRTIAAVATGRYANCTAAHRAGVTPIYRGEPGYALKLDRDKDGIACE
ncbi:excalibur calcium-binding domain-containing protein [Microbacterium marinilacus]|uniref:Excalibur calcium-binding domain-containing protein n=1 Tax=Microbacterium marinilacus TaxID=415209 RepID=A0ABP7B805_9MICO|nr:excalibur calcium-binding domain-containing protein [Microbacterium marinilacus]MBY0687479.1 excalibur calcium-binding domain-containing protein [Microbacterium marinilacus]